MRWGHGVRAWHGVRAYRVPVGRTGKGVPRASRPQCVADPHRSQPRSDNTTIATRCRTLRAQTATPPCTLACTRTAATTCAQPGESAWSRAGPCAAVCLPPGEMPRAPPTVSVRPGETAWMRGWDACLGATDTAICVTVHASHMHTPLTPAEPAQSPRSPLHPAAPLARRSATRADRLSFVPHALGLFSTGSVGCRVSLLCGRGRQYG